MTKEPIDMKYNYTCEGEPVELITTIGREPYPVVGYVDENIMRWCLDGRSNANGTESRYDLIRVPTKREGWINLYRKGNSVEGSSFIHATKEIALGTIVAVDVIATIRIEWEE